MEHVYWEQQAPPASTAPRMQLNPKAASFTPTWDLDHKDASDRAEASDPATTFNPAPSPQGVRARVKLDTNALPFVPRWASYPSPPSTFDEVSGITTSMGSPPSLSGYPASPRLEGYAEEADMLDAEDMHTVAMVDGSPPAVDNGILRDSNYHWIGRDGHGVITPPDSPVLLKTRSTRKGTLTTPPVSLAEPSTVPPPRRLNANATPFAPVYANAFRDLAVAEDSDVNLAAMYPEEQAWMRRRTPLEPPFFIEVKPLAETAEAIATQSLHDDNSLLTSSMEDIVVYPPVQDEQVADEMDIDSEPQTSASGHISGRLALLDVLASEELQHQDYEAILAEARSGSRGKIQTWMQPAVNRAHKEYEKLRQLTAQHLPTFDVCKRIVYILAKYYGILPDGLEIAIESPPTHPSGGGGFADIYIVKRRGNFDSELVCMKRLRLFRDTPETKRAMMRKNFCHEAMLWKSLDHPNVLPFLGVNTDRAICGESFALISPYLPNGNVMSYMDRNPSMDRVRAIKQIVNGLEYLHRQSPPVIHGDIKGANVLVDNQDNCRICDFGLSIVTESVGMPAATASSHVKGSVPWMAPELLFPGNLPATMRGEARDARPRDIYAFGCTMLEVLTGKAPWWDEHKAAMSIGLDVHAGKRPKRPASSQSPALTDPLWRMIECCWRQDPKLRLQAAEVVTLLSLH